MGTGTRGLPPGVAGAPCRRGFFGPTATTPMVGSRSRPQSPKNPLRGSGEVRIAYLVGDAFLPDVLCSDSGVVVLIREEPQIAKCRRQHQTPKGRPVNSETLFTKPPPCQASRRRDLSHKNRPYFSYVMVRRAVTHGVLWQTFSALDGRPEAIPWLTFSTHHGRVRFLPVAAYRRRRPPRSPHPQSPATNVGYAASDSRIARSDC
jgi:hypothetical protein